MKKILGKLENIRITETLPIITPKELKARFPLDKESAEMVLQARETITNILDSKDKRFLVILGPCSIHDTKAALDYATRLAALAKEVQDTMFLVMRVYFEKPRTTVGWKGFMNDPFLDGSCDINTGLIQARELLLAINRMGLGAGTEFLDPLAPQYLADLVGWTAIGARTTESQIHREMASGLSMPVGFKNGTDGGLQIAINAMISAQGPHSFIGIDENGRTSIIRTSGNPYGHVVLRGGGGKVNYEEKDLERIEQLLAQHKMRDGIMIDCSHENSNKNYEKQGAVFGHVVAERLYGRHRILGAMLESNINPGSQSMSKNPHDFAYGVSITDACVGWEETEKIVRGAHKQLLKKQ